MAAIVLTVASMTSQTVTGYQYWFDNDTLSNQSGAVTSDRLTLEPDLSGMPYGIHFFNLRLHDSDGVWGAPYRKSFLTVDSRSGAVAYEYWIDDDYDKKVVEEITSEGAVFNVDLSGHPHGLHFFNLRLRTNGNEWGSIYRKVFFTTPTQTGAVAYEYWIDDNYDGKTEGAVTDGDNVYAVSLEGLKKGIHRFSYRMKTAEGEWGSVYTKLFHYTSKVTFTDYEYWLDNDYAHKVSGKDTSGMTSFAVDLDSLPRNEIHHFNMRVRDDNGEWGSVYRKLLVLYNDSAKVPVKGYRHYLNGRDLGYVPVDNNPDGKYTFVIDVPEGEGFDMSDVPVTFDGDSLSVSHTSAFDYKIQPDSEIGASPAWAYSFDSEVNYGTSAQLVDVPSSFNITRPSRTEFRAIKFNTDGRTLYVRATRKATLDIYRDGEKLTTVPADSIIGTQALTLAEGTYFGVIYNVADGEGDITFHLMDTNNQVPTPDIKFENGWVEITDRNKDAVIHYTIDDENISMESPVYEEKFEMRRNCVIRAMAVVPDLDLRPSDIAVKTIASYIVDRPIITFDNLQVVITPDSHSGVKTFYRLDGQTPTESDTEYIGPFTLNADAVVVARSFKAGYTPSEVTSFNYVHASYVTLPPTITVEGIKVTLKETTEGSSLWYGVDESDPAKFTEYKAPFDMSGNGTIYANARKIGMYDSRVVSRNVNDRDMPTPTATFANRQLTLSCTDDKARIHYSTDPSAEKSAFTVYETPLTLTSDCTVRFYATREYFNDSEINSFEFTLSDYQEPMAQITKDYRNRKITIEAGECKLAVTINGSTVEYRSPVTIDVTPDMAAVSVVTLARNEDRYDSDPEEEQLVFHPTPVIGYDGHAIDVRADENDPSANPEIKVTFNDKPVGADSPIDGFGGVTAHVESDEAFRSEETAMAIDRFNTGSKAGARNGHRLSEAFAEWNAGDGYPELTVVGDINREDLTFLSAIEELTTLHLMPDSMADEPYDGALENSRIETVTLKEAPGGLLDGMPRLTGVVWRDSDTPVPEGFAGAPVNPNLLLWVSDRKLAPGDVGNVVTYAAAGEGLPSGTTGHADNMTLTSGYPYGAYRPVEVNHIEFVKQFNQTTEKGVCRGWETIALPFVPDEIRHRDKGPVVPYERWETEYGSGVYGDEGPKPFWIYEATTGGWNPVEEMESGRPYIISMPDSPEYIESYNLAGEVIFSADGVVLGVETEEPFPHSTDWVGGLTFTATFMPVDGSHRSLNNEWDEAIGDVLPGSVFTPDAETLPFEAYVTGPGPRDIPVSGGGSGITLPSLSGYGGISVEATGGGCIRIVSRRACSVDIHTPAGAKIRSVDLTPEESVTVRDLTPGIYIIAGRKVVVR